MRRRPATWLVNGALLVVAALTLFPLFWMFAASLMPAGQSSTYPPPLWPSRPTLANYRELFAHAGIGRQLLNSLVIATSATLLALTFNVAAGYAFAKLDFPGRQRVQQILVGALVIPAQVAMLPLFLMLKSLGLVNTLAGVLVPSLAGVFSIFLVRQAALTVPDELLDAARIDGAGELTIFRRIVLPLLTPILVTLAVFTFLGAWNDFLWPLIVLNDGDRYTLPVALASLSREHVQDSELMMAGSVVTVVPVLALFLALQRYYMQGLTAGAVKG
ncbi:MAG: carbohydrate ABC transporter permease [Proteobacteria bacterium]|nr:carbohydrate ABC transporter permease [Pseudomonadota bacterium]